MDSNMDSNMDGNMDGNIDYKYISLIKTYANFIVSLNTNPDTVIVVKRILHILNLFLRHYEINTLVKVKQLNSIFSSMLASPPWDEEDVIFDHLTKLCDYLFYHYPNRENIEVSITEDIQNITLSEEIKKILELDFTIKIQN